MSHAQNTCMSLLILCATVTLWRRCSGQTTRGRGDAKTRGKKIAPDPIFDPSLSASPRTGVFPFAAGLTGGLLIYKPQLAAVLAMVMVLDLGWRAAAGFAISAFAL